MKIVKSKIKGIKPGDEIRKINNFLIDDLLDVKFRLMDEQNPTIEIYRGGKSEKVQINETLPRQPFIFERSVNEVKVCENNCIFCFVDQLPEGLRNQLYLKDDDYRLSILDGNFITLSNLTDEDIEKITTYNISPLYVSLHSTNPQVRQKLFGKKEDGLQNFNNLSEEGILFHVQIVVVPGVSDGENLIKTLEDLVKNKNVLSISIVPVAKTKYCKKEFEIFNKESSKEIIGQVNDFKEKRGVKSIYLADEFFLLANMDLPDTTYYDDYPQLENGIGIGRKFIDEINNLSLDLKATIVTGKISYAILKKAFSRCESIEIVPIKNTLFGKKVTVTGLLSGKDIMNAINEVKGKVFIPDVALNSNGLFLDDLTIVDIEKNSKADIYIVPAKGEEFINFIKELN